MYRKKNDTSFVILFHALIYKIHFFSNVNGGETYLTFFKIEITIGKEATSAKELLFCEKIKYIKKLPAYGAGS